MKRRAAATAVGTVGALVLMISPATADVEVTNTETVKLYLNDKGEVDSAKVYDQIDLTGSGNVSLRNPVTEDGLRNLDGFGGYTVEDGEIVVDTDVDGDKRLRSVSDYTDEPPLSVAVEYRLDGEEVEASDVVGKSGELEVIYRVKNETGEMQDVSYDDGTGNMTTSQEEVFVPMVGSMTMVLPSTFTEVRSDQANAAGDGRGGTKLSFTLTLFPPIGSPEQEFGYTAQITDGIIPAATLTALPVSPLESPSFSAAADGYSSGAQSGIELAEGAGTLDENLLKLRDGAAELLAGLIQLRDGSEELSAGLVNEAAPGSRELADGLGNELAPGADKLADGNQELYVGLRDKLAPGAGALAAGSQELATGLNNELAPGADKLAAGSQDLAAGSGQLAAGLGEVNQKAPAAIAGLEEISGGLDRLDVGLTQLYDGMGALPQNEGVQKLHAGIAQLKAGLGDTSNSATLIGGIEAIRVELNRYPGALDKIAKDTGCADTILQDLISGTGFDSACYGSDAPETVPTFDDETEKLLVKLQELLAPTSGLATSLRAGLDADQGILNGLMGIECGLSNQTLPGVCDTSKPGLLEGLADLDAGVSLLVSGVVGQVQGAVGQPDDVPDDKTLRGGVNGLSDGVDQIALGGQVLLEGLALLGGGANELAAGNSALAAGAGQLADGSHDAADGADRVADGAGQLSDGADDAADGANQLADGANRLSDGADEAAAGADRLADGLGDAAVGSDKLYKGLQQAADATPQLVDGAQRLSTEGSSQIEIAGQETAVDYGTRYAVLEASADRADNEPLVNGAPDDAVLMTAFSYELPEVSGEGRNNLTRGLLALGVFALAGGLGALLAKRRHVA